MKIQLFGKNASSISEKIKSFGFSIVKRDPDLIISYGGDGTLLASERTYPSIPKLPIRDSLKCIKCSSHTEEMLLESLAQGKLKLHEYPKLEADVKSEKLLAVNDVVIRNQSPVHAVRLTLAINHKLVTEAIIIGDGLVISTAFGSSGYYKSITKKSFTQGFYIAFNNTTEEYKPIPFSAKDTLDVKIVRGPGTLSADNDPALINLEKGDHIKIKVSQKKLRIYEPQTLRCKSCKVFREKH